MFVDENKSAGLLLVGACYASRDVVSGRAHLKGLLLPGQERLHFSHERDVRRRRILDAALEDISKVIVVHAGLPLSARQQRRLALAALVDQGTSDGVSRVWIEQDDSVVAFDRKVVFESSRMSGDRSRFSYGWLRPRQEPLLWAADAIAWAWARGGSWRKRVADGVETMAMRVP
jgi:hypothetical protein